MKNYFASFILAVSFLWAAAASAQLGNVTLQQFPGAASGNCPNSFTVGLDLANGGFYTCPSDNLWTVVGGSGGGGTVTSITGGGLATTSGGNPITTTGRVTVQGTGNGTSAVSANANFAGGATNDVVIIDGFGNAADSLTQLGALLTTVPYSIVLSGTNTTAAEVQGSGSSLVPAGTGQITGVTNWLQPGGAGLFASIPTLTGALTGGNFSTASVVHVQITINQGSNHSFPSFDTNIGLNAGNNCASGNVCSVTVTAPTLIGSQTYSVYSSATSGTELLNSSCTNITINCVLTTYGLGAAVPTTNTAAGITPTPVGHTSDCRFGLNPIFWVKDGNLNYEQAACVDTTMTVNQFLEKGFIVFSRPVLFDDSASDPAGISNFSYNGALNVHLRPSANFNGNGFTNIMGQQILLDDDSSDVATYTGGFRGLYSEIDVHGNPAVSGIDSGHHALRGTSAALYTGGAMTSGNQFVGVSGFAQRTSVSNAVVSGDGFKGLQGIAQDNGTTGGGIFTGVWGQAFYGGGGNSQGLAFKAASVSVHFPAIEVAYYADSGWTAASTRWLWLSDGTTASSTYGTWAMQGINPQAGAFPFTAPVTSMSSLSTAQIATPGPPGISQGGTAGSTSYSYLVVALDGNGGAIAGAPQSMATGNATLNATNFNLITFTCQPGAASYDIRRTVAAGTPSSLGKIGNKATVLARGAAATCNFSDTGLAGDSTSTPVGNTTGGIQAQKFSTLTNCANGATPAVCASASAGAVALPTGTNSTLTVNTTAVTATSNIQLTVDESLTISGVTCNTTLSTLLNPVVTARVVGVSFTFTIGSTLATNPACVSYNISN
jgi:hypothetical protein